MTLESEIDQKSTEMLSQNRYDLDNKILNSDEIQLIKTLVKEKRVEYSIAPIGTNIFRFVREKEPNIYFEKEPFDNKDLDALIYLPNPNREMAFIILNSNQPLINQVFATAHEYYHYIKDFEVVRHNPKVCSLSSSREKSEQKASRFAAELLLPDEALRFDIQNYIKSFNIKSFKNLANDDFVAICCVLTIKYSMPLKAVLFRLHEEGYISDIENYLSNYKFIKRVFLECIHRQIKKAEELVDTENHYVEEIMYDLIPRAYQAGFVSIDKIKNDIKKLHLNPEIIEDFEDNDDELGDEELSSNLKKSLLDRLNE